MSDNLSSEEPRPDVPTPPVFVARSDSDKLRLAPNTDNSPTIISAPRRLTGAALHSDDLRGRRLGHFELIEPIGAGGMAAVLRARDLNLGRDVALKILPPEAARDPEHVARFRSEARAAAKLDHENVARVFDSGEDQGVHFIAFEFVEGVDLRTLIERRGPLPAAEAVHYLLQAATGLAHAAERGVVHRDIKPSNILITPAGRAKIVDMGLARHRDGFADGLTHSGVTLGTFDYISPEQALEPRTADPRSDIYSLGCTFYHMLTGQPPVPEGTAAKKLHHHQHVPPPDPRAYNPAIPADLALVLGRMMAKDPQDRYQRPQDVVHDLLELSRRLSQAATPLGSDTDRTLWADAPVPRLPALLAAAGVLAVAVLVAVVEMSRPAPRPRPVGSPLTHLFVPGDPPASVHGNGANRERERSEGASQAPVAPGLSAPTPLLPRETVVAAADASELRRLFRERREPELRVRLTGPGPYDLGQPGDPGLTFRGRRLTLEGAEPGQPLPEVRFCAGPDGKAIPGTPAGQAAAMSVAPERDGEGVSIVLKGVRFVCDPAPGAGPLPSAVAAHGLIKFDAERCAFVLPELPTDRPAGALVLAGRAGAPDPPEVRLTECLFLRGSRAIELLGPAHVVAAHCAFGPHSALVHLHDTGDADATVIRFDHCSVLLENGAVFHAEDEAGGLLIAGHCLFSRPLADATGDPPGDVVLVRQTGSSRGRIVYQSHAVTDGQPQHNGYHNLSAFWSDETPAAGPRRAATPDAARRLFPDFRDLDALELPLPPWQDSRPLARLADSPQAAFAVNTQLARLRLPREGGVLGVERNVWGPSYPPIAAVVADPALLRTRVVDPARETDLRLGIYATLAQALEAARTDDIILIKKNGVLAEYPTPLYRPDLRLTIKPFPNYRPVLTLAATPDPDAALFRLYDGELTLEGLEFALRAGPAGVKSQAVAALVGNGLCQFRRCVITLDEADDAQFAAALVPDADPVARPGSDRRAVPRARFEGCFVRGKGDLLSAHNGRRFELELDGTLVALDGTLAAVEGAGKEPAGFGAAQVRLRRATTVLTEHVLALRAARDGDRHAAGLPPTQVSCEESLLVAAARRPLVRLENVDSEDQVRQLLLWGEGRHTLYGNTGPTLLEMVPTAPDRLPLPVLYDQERWLTFTHEPGAAPPFVRVRFAVPFAADRLTRSQPADFKPFRPDFTPPPDVEYGASVERLPRPSDE